MGDTIGVIMLSYDINKLHTNVKDEMLKLGYSERWRYGNGPTYEMPNTTLWHDEKSSNLAINDLQRVCNRLGVKLEKAVAALSKEFSGV
ncbi:hypothetical protein MKO06_15580 [Gramella sp. GC03-9]|uniref:Uncharacterized protein n=1 Tax=Christiangramia oceanisediminis TaxID=2920386 RepID=A0A9X2KZT3_9FLAO|nr:hypothetical protein [Gramella oceanisediminis]MCP9201330.1 hypothetical protein [Gramella oceanisediminis]